MLTSCRSGHTIDVWSLRGGEEVLTSCRSGHTIDVWSL